MEYHFHVSQQFDDMVWVSAVAAMHYNAAASGLMRNRVTGFARFMATFGR